MFGLKSSDKEFSKQRVCVFLLRFAFASLVVACWGTESGQMWFGADVLVFYCSLVACCRSEGGEGEGGVVAAWSSRAQGFLYFALTQQCLRKQKSW